ncbi:MAG: histidinol phosphate phosphatase domain-containing protein [Chloroflexi bacterium]|nr:histidinol phosphate phosphatase domain-containing protein [Chloroflexota bacterium]
MVFDFHTHTFLSDGSLSPVELIRRAKVNGYQVIAVTDHAGMWDQERILQVLVKECELASREMDILAIPGVELTHVPKSRINEAARRAKELGARIVVVHGETIVEPVEEGTNLAAVQSSYVDILAHPGILRREEAKLALEHGIFLELSARRGHSLTNGHVARVAASAGAQLILDSDAHEPQDLLTSRLARQVVRGAGLPSGQATQVLQTNPRALLRRLKVPLEGRPGRVASPEASPGTR